MSHAVPSVPTAPSPVQVRRATRSADESLLGGVASGLAAHLGVRVQVVRAAFVISGVLGIGLVYYAGLWLVLPLEHRETATAPGLAAAGRQGKRPSVGRRVRDNGPLVALGAVALGVGGLVGPLVGRPGVVWPGALAVVGVLVLWRQADEAQRERWADATGGLDLRRVLLGAGGTAAWARLVTGVGLLVAALVLFAVRSGRLAAARDVVLAGGLGMLGLALTLGPWVVRLVTDLSRERAERIRSEERADVAAHLHDSVLQTLALIQKSAADPSQVTRLARAQERDLRDWLYGVSAGGPDSLSAALRAAAAEVEDSHGVPVEVVTVGDVPGGQQAEPLLAAARQAMLNAAQHSGADRVDVYAEVSAPADGHLDRLVEVFVRDRGAGFDLTDVPADRLGVRGSIIDRMQRHGGRAEVRSGAGRGTEVRLAVRVPCLPGVSGPPGVSGVSGPPALSGTGER